MSEPHPTIELGERVDILQGFAFRSDFFSQERGLPLVRIRDLGGETTEARYWGPFDPRFLVNAGDILIGMDGDFVVRRWTGQQALLNQRVCRVRPLSSELDDRFLYHALAPEIARVHRRTPQTTVRHLTAKGIRSCRVLDVCPSEQERIGEVLDTIDRAIAATEQSLTKERQLLGGVIDEQIRAMTADPQIVRTLGDLVDADAASFIQTGPFGSQLHAWEYQAVGVPVFMPQDIVDGELNSGTAAKITPQKAASLSRHILREGDVVIGRRGDLSRCAAVSRTNAGGLCGSGSLLIRPPRALPARWLTMVYTHDFVQRQIAARAVGSTMMNLSAGLIRNLRVPCPEDQARERIEHAISAVRARIATESAALAKLKILGLGLAADLLTGRIRTLSA